MKDLYKILLISEAIVSLLLIVLILVQGKGAGLSDVFGGGGASYSSKRGFEKKLHYFTVLLGVLFLGIGLGILIYKT